MSTKVIALDAGHGMGTAGKRCLKSIDPNQTREWYLNDRIADIVEAFLAGYDCRVLRVGDTTGAKDVPLSTRTKTANSGKADFYMSIHHNAGINGGAGGGVTVHYYASGKSDRAEKARRLYNAVVKQNGLTGNRSQKIVPSSGLYVLKNTNMPALLLENGFMDSLKDTPITSLWRMSQTRRSTWGHTTKHTPASQQRSPQPSQAWALTVLMPSESRSR